MPPAARIGDMVQGAPHCHSGHPAPTPHGPHMGSIMSGCPKVLIGGAPAARMGDNCVAAPCCGPNTAKIMKGSATVKIGGKPAARMNDTTLHCNAFPGSIKLGCFTVMIGG